MYRRRRPHKEQIAFGFDCFLDVVTNIIGIIIRLILVSWVGARSYTAAMQWTQAEPVAVHALAAPKADDDPLSREMDQARREIEESRRRLAARIKAMGLAETKAKEAERQAATLASMRLDTAEAAKTLDAKLGGKGPVVQKVALTAADLKQRSADVLKEIKKLESQPPGKKLLRYHTPISRAVHADELFFECKAGRVTFIDMSAFMTEMKGNLDSSADALKSQWDVTRTTAPIGAFQVRYTIAREKGPREATVGGPASNGFRFGISEWVLEPIVPLRGENLQQALAVGSQFRKQVDVLDSRITVVTFWVYPDSFEMFRRLRDHLYERGVEVAGRPLPEDAPIAASRHGTASRGQ